MGLPALCREFFVTLYWAFYFALQCGLALFLHIKNCVGYTADL